MCVCYPYQSPGTEKAMTDPGVTILTDEGDPDALESSGTSLADFLYPAPAARDSLSIIKWWEKRGEGDLQVWRCHFRWAF